ncbi:MAG: SDR family NAD(P)-dependent oxidoreductase [Deltaproteobacteria bacterium]|nr:MAG: SDR family NAD(P)-dependent oxidoreductase [Deltaproteobacteria bacterium]
MARGFADKVVWITGGGSGIGAALARELASRGAAVAVSGRRVDRLEGVVAELDAMGARAIAVPCDVTSDAQVAAAVRTVVDELGRLDVAVANAGYGVVGRLESLTEEEWRRQLDVNVLGVVRTARHAIPELRRTRGRLVLMGSVIVYAGVPGNAAYTASKAAVNAIGATLSAELAPDGVSCTTINPGFVASEIGQVDNQGVYHPDRRDPRPARLIWPADKAARAMADAILRRRREAVITGHGRVIAFLGRHFPGLVARLVRRRPSAK